MEKESIINFDFEGWPIRKMTVREILDALGVYDYKIKNENVLDKYPLLLKDDGMGYGVYEQYINEVSCRDDDSVVMFREEEIPHVSDYIDADVYPGYIFDYQGKEYYVGMINEDGDFVLHMVDDDDFVEGVEKHIIVSKEKLIEMLKKQ